MYHESLELDFLPTSMRYNFFLPLLYGDIESNKMKQHEFAWFLGLFMYMYIYIAHFFTQKLLQNSNKSNLQASGYNQQEWETIIENPNKTAILEYRNCPRHNVR